MITLHPLSLLTPEHEINYSFLTQKGALLSRFRGQGVVVAVIGNCARSDDNGGDDIGDGSGGDDPAQLSLRPALTLGMLMR
jgi:hypothetical protein